MRIPKRLRKRPQWRGLPIPYVTFIGENGQPDFRVTDEQRRKAVMQRQICQLCGERLGKYCFFVGGPEAAKANQYFEPAAHLDCLVYAMQVCPFIVGRVEHADIEKVRAKHQQIAEVRADATFSSVRNPDWIIKKAKGWSYARTKDGTILLMPLEIKQTARLHPDTMKSDDWQKVVDELL